MDTNKLKRFATEARNILLSGVAQRLAALGFQPDGTATEKPELLGGGAVFMGEVQSEDFYHKWMSLYRRMQSHSFREVAEEAAYTWFNRLVAIRIMVKNELIPAVLEYESDEVRIPVIVTEARQGRMPQMDEADRQKLDALLLDDALTDEQFALLIVAYCHSNPIISKCFGKIADYTELLLPSNILKNDGFIDRLNADDYISDNDYRSPELIGWLYQFYISERKDEVFAKKGKFEADEIPAATQIFTPNWIVKYMVQNTVGRIYLDNNPYSDIKEGMKYLVEPSNLTPNHSHLILDDVHDLRVADLACGSGHILNECFDLLYQIYIEEGYNRRRAVEDIFRYNLTGVDIDTRAKQLAMFALLLKACQKDRSFADGHVLPRVLDMPKAGLPLPADTRLANEIEAINKTLADADTLGSIMKFNLSPAAREWVVSLGEENETAQLVLALTDKYAALVMNPPYMGSGNMNTVLSNYVKKNYEVGKADLFSVFMQVCEERLVADGKYGMINMQSWMFLSSFEKLRTHLLDTMQIDNMLHLGPRTFDELSGEVVQNTAFVLTKHAPNQTGTYYRLVEGKNCGDKERMFLAGEHCYPHISQQNFKKIPGCPIGYWVSNTFMAILKSEDLGHLAHPRRTIQCGDVVRFIRLWTEVNNREIETSTNINELKKSSRHWFKFTNGGSFRKWYGNLDSVLCWANNGEEIKSTGKAIIPNEDLYFKECIGYNRITSNGITARLYNQGILLGDATSMIVPSESILLFIALLNANVSAYAMKFFNPTLAAQTGSLSKIPVKFENEDVLLSLVSQNISISKSDWDAHETSWDFEENELMRLAKEGLGQITATVNGEVVMQSYSLKLLIEEYKAYWTEQFLLLHTNEEELNRQFIGIYGLEDELTSDVPLEEITILQQGEIRIENGQIVWQNDVIAKQLISYAVGCMLGRYRIDKPGLHIAHPESTAEEIAPYTFNGQQWNIDEDGILPLMPSDTDFSDNATVMFKRWLVVAFGEDTLVDNLNCVEAALGKSLDDYFVKDFWKDHKKMYQNRPIYWLFSSKKGAFQCLAYMHRMNAYTAERIRTKYLLPHIEWLVQKQTEMETNAANLNARERKQLDSFGRQIAECREYHDRLHTVADEQIAFDLDDGVVVNYGKFGDVLAKLK